MKKFLKVFGIILLVLVVLIIGVFVIALIDAKNDDKEPAAKEPVESVAAAETPEPIEIEEPAEESTEEYQLTIDDIINLYEITLKQNFSEEGQGYEVKQSNNVIQINVWSDGISEEAVKALVNDDYKNAWNNMVESFKGTSESFQKVLDDNGYTDMTAMVNVLNDTSKDKTILAVVDGVVMYDAVNGIDLISK